MSIVALKNSMLKYHSDWWAHAIDTNTVRFVVTLVASWLEGQVYTIMFAMMQIRYMNFPNSYMYINFYDDLC